MNGGYTHRGMRSLLVAGALVVFLALLKLAQLLVLTGTGVHELKQAEQLRRGIQFAFHIEGEDKFVASRPADAELIFAFSDKK